MDKKKQALEFIIDKLLSGEANARSLYKIKKFAAKKFSVAVLPKNSEIMGAIPKSKLTPNLVQTLKRKPVRTISGVTPIAVMIRPNRSCNYRCIYCPFTGKAAKSYTGEEPAALRARENDFDPAKQVKSRLQQFFLGGHPAEKCEVIVMGGTFLQTDKEYQNEFIKSIYDALNRKKSANLEAAKKMNETAKHRAIGLTIETRPDVCGIQEINQMLGFGATRVELGVQNPNDSIYKKINRGHSVADVISATQLLKDSSFKIVYHLMPGLPGSNPKKDTNIVKKIFEDQKFKPDMLKIYPTLVIPGTELHKMLARGEYEPYTSEEAAEVISEFYRYIPKYVRVMRIQRDIPSNLIYEGVKKSNLREMVDEQIRKKRIEPKEIRLREAGFAKPSELRELKLTRFDYSASKGKEIFLSWENEKHISGFIRLRIPYHPFRKELTDSALIREFHIYGEEAELSKKGKVQHKGLGSALLEEAEKIATEEFGFRKISVISGVGVRKYFYKQGYKLDGPYVSKSFFY